MSEQLIISIGREFGSAGHEIAEHVAERLGIHLVDNKILIDIAEEQGIELDELKKYDEKKKRPFFSKTISGYTNAIEDHLVRFQFQYLKKMAEEGESFVVVGRCSEYVLRDYPCMTSVFVMGHKAEKIERIMKKYHLSEEEARKMAKNKDWARKGYHNFYAEGKWGDSRNYDLCLNSSPLGVEGATEVILKYVEQKMRNLKK